MARDPHRDDDRDDAPGDWPFTAVSARRVGGGPKTVGAEEIRWTGVWRGRRWFFITRPRTIDAHAHFHVHSNARIDGVQSATFAQYVDLAVDPPSSEEERRALAALAQHFEARPVRVRAKGDRVR